MALPVGPAGAIQTLGARVRHEEGPRALVSLKTREKAHTAIQRAECAARENVPGDGQAREFTAGIVGRNRTPLHRSVGGEMGRAAVTGDQSLIRSCSNCFQALPIFRVQKSNHFAPRSGGEIRGKPEYRPAPPA